MTTTISKVVRTDRPLNEFLCQQCALVAEYGGSFAINSGYDGSSCFTEYTIHWPEDLIVGKVDA